MLRRAMPLVEKARERIRAAAEHDPHAWPERDDDRAILVHDEESEAGPEAPEQSDDGGDAEGATRPPLGSPEPGAPALDGPLGPGGVSGPPPNGGRPHRTGERTTRLLPGRTAGSSDGGAVPAGLRTAAAWSWRLIVVVAGVYVLLYALATIAVVV